MPPGSGTTYGKEQKKKTKGKKKQKEGLDKEETKGGLRFECRSWPAKGVQRVELVGKKRERERTSINLGNLCVSLKGGTGLFVGGDPGVFPGGGQPTFLRAGSPGEVIRKALLKPVKNEIVNV